MTDFVTIKNKIKDFVGNQNLLGTDLNFAVNTAIRSLSRRHAFRTLEASTTIVTVADQAEYTNTVPSDYRSTLAMTVPDTAGAAIPMIQVTKPELDQLETVDIPAARKNKTLVYALYNESVWIFPTPTSVLTLTWLYYKHLPKLSDDSDTNYFTDNAEEILHYEALVQLGLVEELDAIVPNWQTLARRYLNELIAEDVETRHTDREFFLESQDFTLDGLA